MLVVWHRSSLSRFSYNIISGTNVLGFWKPETDNWSSFYLPWICGYTIQRDVPWIKIFKGNTCTLESTCTGVCGSCFNYTVPDSGGSEPLPPDWLNVPGTQTAVACHSTLLLGKTFILDEPLHHNPCRLATDKQLTCQSNLKLMMINKWLALFDYVSRAHEIEIRPSSARLWHWLSLKLLHGFLSNFSCGFPWAICPEFFFIFEKKKFWIFTNIFRFR